MTNPSRTSGERCEEIHLKFTVNSKQLAPGEKPPTPPLEANPITGLSQRSVDTIRRKSGLDAVDPMVFSLDGSADCVPKSQYHYKPSRSLTIHGEYLSLTQLAILARTVHEYHRSYQLLHYQCYWYAEIILFEISKEPSSHQHVSECTVENVSKRVGKNQDEKQSQFVFSISESTSPRYVCCVSKGAIRRS